MTPDDLPLADISPPSILLAALALNLVLCSAGRLSSVFAWPATMAGRLIQTFEARYNRPHATDAMRRADSVSIAIVLVILALGVGLGFHVLLRGFPYGWLVEAAFISILLNIRPHLERMRILAHAARDGGEEARATLSLLTSRDACDGDVASICTAGIESAAMVLTQGLMGPVLWYLIGGLPALLVFKMIDTASTMIDERSENARSFGWAPRCLSALLLFPASILAAPIVVIAALLVPGAHARIRGVFSGRRGRYAWPVFTPVIAAFAAVLGVRLGGPVCIGSFRRAGTFFGPDRKATLGDLWRARSLFIAAGLVVAALLALLPGLAGDVTGFFDF